MSEQSNGISLTSGGELVERIDGTGQQFGRGGFILQVQDGPTMRQLPFHSLEETFKNAMAYKANPTVTHIGICSILMYLSKPGDQH